MRTLKFGLLGAASALALAIALPALSHAEPGKGGHRGLMFEQADTDKSGDLSQAEMRAAAEKHFDTVDANGDGIVTREEADAAKEKLHAGMAKRHGTPEERFAAADANGDGKITLDEMKAAAEKRMAEHGKDGAGKHSERFDKWFSAADKDGDGALTLEELKAGKDRMKQGGMRDGKRGDMFARLDADGDGQIAKAEALAAADRMFERMDANKDGKIERGEGRMHGKHGKGAETPEAE